MTDAENRARTDGHANDDAAGPLETRRKRLIYRSLYTGIKETDLLLGRFARAHVPHFTEAELDQYERLLDVNEDPRIYAWAIGREAVPAAFDTPVMKLLQNFKLT
ncbi:MAG: succinate dehydrogenase assembly factor 2 [Sneathiellaceae bacterium]